jgi:hypothetical protein
MIGGVQIPPPYAKEPVVKTPAIIQAPHLPFYQNAENMGP